MQYPVRKSNRLKQYNYSQNGAYFITICTKNKEKIFWDKNYLCVGERIALPQQNIVLSKYGLIVDNSILDIAKQYLMVKVDKYVVMPNHIHMILVIQKESGSAMRSPTVSNIVNQFKGVATKQIGKSIWQRSFHDHIIRNLDDYQVIWNYINTNPQKWKEDCFYGG